MLGMQQWDTGLVDLCKALQHSPCLLTTPREALSIIDILAKRRFSEFTNAATDDVLHSFIDGLAVPDFMDELKTTVDEQT